MNKLMKRAALCILSMLCLIAVAAVPARAASKPATVASLYSAKASATISDSFSKDMTGNGKKNSVKITASYEDYFLAKISVKMDGKNILTINNTNECFSVKAYYVKMSSSKIFLQFVGTGDNDGVVFNRIYQYNKSSKKLKKVLDLDNTYANKIVSYNAKKSQITIANWAQPAEVGSINWKFIYTYKNGKFTRKSGTTSTVKSGLGSATYPGDGLEKGFKKNQFTVANAFKLYTKAGGSKTAFTAKAKQVLTLKKIKVVKSKIYLQFSYNGKTGWIKVGKSSAYNYKAKNIAASGKFLGVFNRLAG